MPDAPRPSSAILEGPIARALLRLAGPVVLANVFQTLYQLTDTFWVGRLGAEAVAAVSFSFPVVFLFIAVAGGVTIAGTILVAQAEGRGDARQVDYVAGQTYAIVLLLSVVLAGAGYALAEPLLRLMGADPNVLGMAAEYLRLSYLGLPFVFGYFVFQALLRGVGDVKTPLYIVGVTVLLNLVLDPLFILGWGPIPALGVAGAAASTIGTQGLAAAVGAWLLVSGRRPVRVRRGDLRPDLALVREIARLGFPASVDQAMRALGLTVLVTLVAGFGSDAVAVYGVGTRIFSFVLIPALGLGIATSTVVGQNVGAGQRLRARRTTAIGAWIAFGAMTAAGALGFAFAEPLVAAFVPDEPAVIREGARFLRIMAPGWGLIGVQVVIGGGFSGAGRTYVSMLISIASLWVLRFPLAWFLSSRGGLGTDGIWWAFPVSYAGGALVAVVWFLQVLRTPAEDEVAEEKAVAESAVGHPYGR
ncbi:MATE family efflux transporter [Rubrivirga sp. S365]|uniref:MATE family efflux transporter n=1 Tax=Rubrivirga litoralis TaxID=3075598 RepID=A0ABU3BMG3_9BACT|nr:MULTISPECIES: MATE family efflux transporter [unclassified Rubrivirga]MDT0630466.1 MATE family efflux transporter [Rubrivirga sp. F394]MDT7857556.1 MATE family efflux transporter [Rubrivirga sp. S365]